MIEIEKGIPIPEKKRRQYESKYPFRSMAVDDSFFTKTAKANLRCSMRAAEKRIGGGVKFDSRPEEDGYRVWRIA